MKNIYVTSPHEWLPIRAVFYVLFIQMHVPWTSFNDIKAIEDTLTHLRSFLQPTKMMGVSGQNLRICWCQNVLQCCSVSSLVMS